MSAQSDPFASVRLKPIQQKNTQEISQNQSQDPFKSARIKKVEGFPYLYEGGRHLARTASRAAEVLGGSVGDIQSLIQSGVFAGLEKLTGKKASPEAREKIKGERAPTSHELKEFSQKATGGFTSPQNEIEKFTDESVETLASLLGPMKFRKAAGVAIASQLAKEGVKISGLGENAQEATKLGTIFFTSMLNPKGALNYASSLYEKSNQLAKGASISAKPFKDVLENLVMDLQKGVTTPAKNIVLRPAEELLLKIQNGKIPVQDLTAAKRDLNTLMKDPALLKREKKLLKHLGFQIDQAIKPFEKINPEFSKAYRPANEIYGTIMQGQKASDFVLKHLGAKSILGTVLAETALGHPELILPTAGFAGAALGAAKLTDFSMRLAKSPELRKYYYKAALAAAKEDLPALRHYEEKFQEYLND